MRHPLTNTWTVILLALAMLTVTMPAMASHNSIGAHMHVVDPDEFDAETGELVPDIPHEDHPNPDVDETSPHHLTFHNNLDDPRPAPIDQTGTHYTDCTGWEDGNPWADQDEYEDALREGNACYVGYFDQIIEYMFSTLPGLVTETSDSLYSVNPKPDHEYCRGEKDPSGIQATIPETGGEIEVNTGIEPVDVLLTNAWRVNDEECGAGNDNIFLPGDFLIDTSLMEAGNEAASDELGNGAGSGSYTLGFTATTYTFLLGQPHPDNIEGETIGDTEDDEEDASSRELTGPSDFEAGSGPFGPSVAERGNPLHDLTGACGDRTQECKLLTPSDIILYDPWFRDDGFIPEQPRVCSFIPQLSFTVIGDNDEIDRSQGVCGNTGDQMDEFMDEIDQGGFGIQDGPPTWLTNLPGWGWGVLLTRATAAQHTGYAAHYTTDDGDMTTDGAPRPGFVTIHAVNPDVPTREGDLRCLMPNILTDGDGVYGDYQAAAIDVDIYPHPYQAQIEPVIEATHPTVRETVGPVQEAVFGDRDFYDHIMDPVTGEQQNIDLAEDIAGDVVDEQTIEEALNLLPPEVTDAIDRANMVEASSTPEHAQPGPQNQHPFAAGMSDGLVCDASGELVLNDNPVEWQAGLRFDVDISQFTTTLKDPTVFDEAELPAPESETDEGYWQTDVYTASGDVQGVIDFTQTGEFNDCAGANLMPGDDLCPWKSLWDAYSDEQCQNRDQKDCADILEDNGYDTENGVGAFFVLKVTGTTLVTAQPIATEAERVLEHSVILGDGDPTAQNCIVGTTIGFEEKIGNFFTADDLETIAEEELCDDVDGDTAVFERAFSPQSGVTPGNFNIRLSWAPLLPTPDASGLDAGDSLCVMGIWSTVDDPERDYTGDTAGDNNINLPADGSVHSFGHWQSLQTGTDTPGHDVANLDDAPC